MFLCQDILTTSTGDMKCLCHTATHCSRPENNKDVRMKKSVLIFHAVPVDSRTTQITNQNLIQKKLNRAVVRANTAFSKTPRT